MGCRDLSVLGEILALLLIMCLSTAAILRGEAILKSGNIAVLEMKYIILTSIVWENKPQNKAVIDSITNRFMLLAHHISNHLF